MKPFVSAISILVMPKHLGAVYEGVNETGKGHCPSWTGGVARSAGVVVQEKFLEQPPRLHGFGGCAPFF
jgi:hypothetical protein